MNKAFIAGAVAVVAVFGGVIWFASDRGETPQATPVAADPAAADKAAAPEPLRSTSGLPVEAQKAAGTGTAVPADPRLAALAVSPDNGLINFVTGDNGKVIREVDNDPNSPSYQKPLREYMYAGDRVVGLTSYQYQGDQVQISRTVVTYKPDGSIDQYLESMRYESGKKRGNSG
jgi:hypothetical protein